MTNNSSFGDINNCNSLNIGVVSSTIVNSIRRNSFYKLTNVLLLLFLSFGSCVVSFGMDGENIQINDQKKDGPVSIAPRDQYLGVPSIINKISMLFLTKVMSVDEKNMNGKVDNVGNLICWLPLLGLNEILLYYETDNNKDNSVILIYYSIGTILAHSLYRGIFSVKPCLKIIKEGGNCELYFGVGNVPYVGWLFNFSLVCKPTKYLPDFLQNKVTIHIFDIKPFNFILGCVLYTLLTWYTECKKLYIRPQWILGFGTVEINIAKYYNISFNVGSWIVDWITFMKYTKKANKNEIKINELENT